MRAVIYARYSSDRQSPRSVADQIDVCRRHATIEGWQVVGVFADQEIGGAHILTREGVQQLLRVAEMQSTDIVLSEMLDRLSRSQSDVAHIYELLQWNGVQLVTLSEGLVTELHIGLSGTMGALHLKKLKEQTRRGLRARARDGLATTRPPYGYVANTVLDASGIALRGKRRIVEEEAEVVRRIYREYVDGQSLGAIGRSLVEDGIPAPAGRNWVRTTLHRVARGGVWGGILHHDAYVGRLVYGRCRVTHHPETGRRRDRLVDEAEWIVAQVPEWRILDDALWEEVQDRVEDQSRPRRGLGPRRRRPLTGTLQCGACGTRMEVRERDLYVCPERQRRGSACPRSVRAPVPWAEQALPERILAQLRAHPPDWEQRLQALRETDARQTRALRGSLTRAQAKTGHLLALVEAGTDGPEVRARIRAREDQIAALTQQITAAPQFPEVLPDDFHVRLLAHVEGLARAAQSGRGQGDAKNPALRALAALTTRCAVMPIAAGRGQRRARDLHLEITIDERACLAVDLEQETGP